MMMLRKTQRGFSAIAAIVLIVLFALIGTYMATLSTVGSLNTTQSHGSMQAWFAARSGMDWAVYDAIQNNAGTLNCGAVGPNFTISGGAGNDFNIQVTCVVPYGFIEVSACPAASPCTTYSLTVVANRGNAGDITYLSRTIRASVTNAP
jgi:MSHA biogenesis protein MshP